MGSNHLSAKCEAACRPRNGPRVELAALGRLVAHFKWTDTIDNHITLRVPGEDTFLINPFGLLYEEVTASRLVKTDVRGNVLDDPTGMGINRAGFVIHSAIHEARSDVHCIIHTHTRAGAAVSAQELGLLPISQHAATVLAPVTYHDFEGIAVHLDEQKRLADDIGDRFVVILRNHGLLACGRNAAHVFWMIVTVERVCEIQIVGLLGGSGVNHISSKSLASTADTVAHSSDFSFDWADMLRLAEREAPEFCH